MDDTPTHSYQPRIFCVTQICSVETDCACTGADADSWLQFTPSNAVISNPLVSFVCSDQDAEYDCACSAADADTTNSSSLFMARVVDSVSNALDYARRSSTEVHLSNLPNVHTAVFSPFIPGHIAVMNSAAKQLLNRFANPAILTQAPSLLADNAAAEAQRAAYQMAALGLLRPSDDTARPRGQSRTLSAWLHLTDACNLRCSYCYVTKSIAQMDEGTGRAAIDAILRSASRNDYRTVKLKYAGGEPTLCFDLVRALHAYAAARAKESGIALQEVILSNGVALTSGILDFLKSEGIRQMISLDGLGPDHDGQRPFKNGAPSSRYVLQALDRAVAQGVQPHISISVRPSNVASLAETVRFVLDRDLLFNLNFVREALPASSEWETEFIIGIRSALAVIEERLPKRRLIDGLLDRCNFAGAHDYPCGAGRDYMAVTPQGKIARCHMTLSQPVGDIWVEDPLKAVRATAGNTEFQGLSADARTECRNCMWRSVCAGGCPLQTVRTKGREDVASPYCNIYRAILPELVRLEGLRILKWESAN